MDKGVSLAERGWMSQKVTVPRVWWTSLADCLQHKFPVNEIPRFLPKNLVPEIINWLALVVCNCNSWRAPIQTIFTHADEVFREDIQDVTHTPKQEG